MSTREVSVRPSTPFEEEYSTPQASTPLYLNDSKKSIKDEEEEYIDEFEAIEALRQLKSGGGSSTPNNTQESVRDKANEEQDNENYDDDGEDDDENEEEEEEEEFYDTNNEIIPNPDANKTGTLRKGKRRRFLKNAIEAYNSSPALKYGVEMMERATQPMVSIIEQKSMEWQRKRRLSKATEMFPDDVKELTTKEIGPAAPLVRASLSSSYASKSGKRGRSSSSSSSVETVGVSVTPSSVIESLSSSGVRNKKQKLPSISEALTRGNELSLNMSIESRKRLNTCLQLLMLANKQLSTKIDNLQDLINKEQEELNKKKLESSSSTIIDADNDVFHDARDVATTNEIKQEIVGTVKKVVTFISKYAGKSLPEPERSSVRQELLKLPNKWANNQATNSILDNTNGKVLVLANESLEMVKSISSVFDESLAKAELWVKKKQEKHLAKQAILNSSLKRQMERK